MSTVFEQLERRALAPDPEPPANAEIDIYHDQSRDGRTVTYGAFVAEWRNLGYRRVMPPERLADLSKLDPPKPGLALARPRNAGTAEGVRIWQLTEARRALHEAATALAPRVQAETYAAERFREKAAELGTVYHAAVLGHVVVQLCERVDALESELAALKAAQEGN